MVPERFPSIGVIGLGQIGGSIALKLKDAASVSFFARSSSVRERGEALGLHPCADLRELSRRAQIIFICVPVDQVAPTISELFSHLRAGHIISDVASTKEAIMSWSSDQTWPEGCSFVGGHPLAGNDVPGLDGADPELFTGRPWILTFDGDPMHPDFGVVLPLLKVLLEGIGARIGILDPIEHDGFVARISHLEHLIALSLVDLLMTSPHRPILEALAAGSFRDATRVAGSSATMVVPFLESNGSLPHATAEFIAKVSEFSAMLNTPGSIDAAWKSVSDFRGRFSRPKFTKSGLVITDMQSALSVVRDQTQNGNLLSSLRRHGQQLEAEFWVRASSDA